MSSLTAAYDFCINYACRISEVLSTGFPSEVTNIKESSSSLGVNPDQIVDIGTNVITNSDVPSVSLGQYTFETITDDDFDDTHVTAEKNLNIAHPDIFSSEFHDPQTPTFPLDGPQSPAALVKLTEQKQRGDLKRCRTDEDNIDFIAEEVSGPSKFRRPIMKQLSTTASMKAKDGDVSSQSTNLSSEQRIHIHSLDRLKFDTELLNEMQLNMAKMETLRSISMIEVLIEAMQDMPDKIDDLLEMETKLSKLLDRKLHDANL